MNEADRLFKMFIDYTMRMNKSRCYDVSVILEGFSRNTFKMHTSFAIERK